MCWASGITTNGAADREGTLGSNNQLIKPFEGPLDIGGLERGVLWEQAMSKQCQVAVGKSYRFLKEHHCGTLGKSMRVGSTRCVK